MRESDLDVSAWRVVRIDVRCLRMVDLDVFWIYKGCVHRLDDENIDPLIQGFSGQNLAQKQFRPLINGKNLAN